MIGTQGTSSTALCGADDVATGGGFLGAAVGINVEQSQPVIVGPGTTPNGWQASTSVGELTAYVICHDA
ncbi:hypothetical protein [Streptomyces sp. NPDC005407]|uniref:hypothetical protein n=1 Tax=Streptomyces sp. NPDC005407 TaxID=3155340 RepID=UPI0033BE7206